MVTFIDYIGPVIINPITYRSPLFNYTTPYLGCSVQSILILKDNTKHSSHKRLVSDIDVNLGIEFSQGSFWYPCHLPWRRGRGADDCMHQPVTRDNDKTFDIRFMFHFSNR